MDSAHSVLKSRIDDLSIYIAGTKRIFEKLALPLIATVESEMCQVLEIRETNGIT